MITESLRLLRMIEVIVSEMAKGNFSFAILVVGILQLLAMIVFGVLQLIVAIKRGR